MAQDKVWTINVQVNTAALANYPESGSWERPAGTGRYWHDNVRMTAVSTDPNDGIKVGTGDNFVLNVGLNDEIKWVVSEVNPRYINRRSVCMYGFQEGSNWDKCLMRPSAPPAQAAFTEVITGFNAQKEPQEQWLECNLADISIPQTKVRANAQSASVQYYMKLVVVDIDNVRNPKALKYIQIDPTINIIV